MNIQVNLILWLYINILAFDEVPVSQEIPVGSEAVFRCRHPTADIVRWRVNNSFVGRNPPPDIVPGTTLDEDGNLVDTLTIVAIREYNGTTVVCVADFDDGTRLSSEPPAILLIQGVSELYLDITFMSIYTRVRDQRAVCRIPMK